MVNSIPECLKTYSSRKVDLLKDFNECLAKIINMDSTHPVIFTLSDPVERREPFLRKLFAESIIDKKEPIFMRLELNPIIDKSIEK